MSELRLAAVQHDIAWNDRDVNFERLAPKIAGAVACGAQLVLLTETFSTGFGFGSPGFESEITGGRSSQFLAEQAKEHGVWVGGSCPEIHPDAPDDDLRPSNCFVLAGLEIDVCIAHSALGLAAAGYRPVVIDDACGSPPPHQPHGLRRLRDAGITVTSVKGIFYEWVRDLETHHRVKALANLRTPEGLTP